MSEEPMKCNKCGATMNQHAVKVDYGVEDSVQDAAFDGVLQEVHQCPKCGGTQLRIERLMNS